MSHIPVLLHETIAGLSLKQGGTYVDCTVNRAGHSKVIADQIGKNGTLICIDLDKDALQEARKVLTKGKARPHFHFVHSNFRHIRQILQDLDITHVDGVLADFGLSSEELEVSGRGFSFKQDEPLLMTFDSEPGDESVTAYDIVNFWSESTIADIIYGFSDETYARRIARAIVQYRERKEILRTHELVSIIESAVPKLYTFKKTHPATKTFQALRMAVNDELGSIKDLLLSLPHILTAHGRGCFITFHSTEDRITKQLLRSLEPEVLMKPKKAIIPSDQECKDNPRARSAQLRIVEHI